MFGYSIKILGLGIMMLLSFVVTSQDTIKIASWNTFLLPRLAKKSNQKERAKTIASYLLKQDYDVICLQEVFHKKALRIIKDSLSKKYKNIIVANKSGVFKTSSGLMIASNIKEAFTSKCKTAHFKKFNKLRGIDAYARKGVQAIRYKSVKGNEISIFNTPYNQLNMIKQRKLEAVSWKKLNN